MVFFRVTKNVNIKIQDNSLVHYKKIKNPSALCNETIYCSVYDDLESLKRIFERVGKEYGLKTIPENTITKHKKFPRELGVSNYGEYALYKKYNKEAHHFLNEKFQSLFEQTKTVKKEIQVAIIGGVGNSIGEAICGGTALRILKKELQKIFKKVTIDIFIKSSENSFYSRDKQVLYSASGVDHVKPLAISTQEFFEYDFFIDNSSVSKRDFFAKMPYVDAYLYSFGIDPDALLPSMKYNQLDLKDYTPSSALQSTLNQLKKVSKLLLFHPYTADVNRSFPKEVTKQMLKELIHDASDYTVVSALDLGNIKDERFVSLHSYSKEFNDFVYIISQMDAVISADTATYHISDAFLVPTCVIFTQKLGKIRTQYYDSVKYMELTGLKQEFSHFEFGNDTLSLYHHEKWEEIKIKQILKELESLQQVTRSF